MKISITFNVRSTAPGSTPAAGLCNDADEEFDAPETIAALADVLTSLGHEVELLASGEVLVERLLKGPRPDLVFNIAEGRGGRSREAHVPALLEMLNIPFTGSDPLTLAATLDKDCAKRLVMSAGVAAPAGALYDPSGDDWREQDFRRRLAKLAFPVIVKPAHEGSSKGVLNASVVDDHAGLDLLLDQVAQAYSQPVLVEEFIEGDELTVGIVGHEPQVLGVMRVLPTTNEGRFVYSLEVKRDWRRQVRYECPAALAPDRYAAVVDAALTCWHALGCRDVARIDFRLRDGVPYFLEANPLPGLSPESGDLVILARAVGICHAELVERIVAAACRRLNLPCAGRAAAPLAVTENLERF